MDGPLRIVAKHDDSSGNPNTESIEQVKYRAIHIIGYIGCVDLDLKCSSIQPLVVMSSPLAFKKVNVTGDEGQDGRVPEGRRRADHCDEDCE